MEEKIILILVALPARGKSFTSNNLCRFLNWSGINTKIFNSGDYRRQLLIGFQDADFFDTNNKENYEKKEDICKICYNDLLKWLKNEGDIAIFDSTNSSKIRRKYLYDEATKVGLAKNIFFIELITNQENIIENNLILKQKSPDYVHKDKDEAINDFKKRLSFYENIYETIDDSEDLNYIKIINFTEKIYIKNIIGANHSLIISYLMNLRLNKHCIYLSRHGESINNILSILGGDCDISEKGKSYAVKLHNFIINDIGNDHFNVYTSCLKRTIQTAKHFKQKKTHTRLLNEIHAGICENKTMEFVKENYPSIVTERKKDKLRYRYPEGESYLDLIERLKFFVLNLETNNSPVIIIAHNAILKVLLAYFQEIDKELIPHNDIPLNTVYKLTPNSVNYHLDKIKL